MNYSIDDECMNEFNEFWITVLITDAEMQPVWPSGSIEFIIIKLKDGVKENIVPLSGRQTFHFDKIERNIRISTRNFLFL